MSVVVSTFVVKLIRDQPAVAEISVFTRKLGGCLISIYKDLHARGLIFNCVRARKRT